MVKGFPYVAVLRHNEKETMPVYRNVQKALDLTFDEVRLVFYRQKSVFKFKQKKHFKLFELHCQLNGMKVVGSEEL